MRSESSERPVQVKNTFLFFWLFLSASKVCKEGRSSVWMTGGLRNDEERNAKPANAGTQQQCQFDDGFRVRVNNSSAAAVTAEGPWCGNVRQSSFGCFWCLCRVVVGHSVNLSIQFSKLSFSLLFSPSLPDGCLLTLPIALLE